MHILSNFYDVQYQPTNQPTNQPIPTQPNPTQPNRTSPAQPKPTNQPIWHPEMPIKHTITYLNLVTIPAKLWHFMAHLYFICNVCFVFSRNVLLCIIYPWQVHAIHISPRWVMGGDSSSISKEIYGTYLNTKDTGTRTRALGNCANIREKLVKLIKRNLRKLA